MSVLLIDAVIREGAKQSANQRTARHTDERRGQNAGSYERSNSRDCNDAQRSQEASAAPRQGTYGRPFGGSGRIVGQGAIVAIATDKADLRGGKACPLKGCHS